MKKGLNFLLMLLMIATVFTACKKADPAPTPAQLIVGKWKEVTNTACEADDITEFTSGGVFTITDGGIKCNSSSPSSSTGTYVLSADGKTLTLTEGGLTIPATVVELTASILKFSFLGNTVSLTKI